MRLNGPSLVALRRRDVLCDPVARYLANAIRTPRRIVAATIEQKGEFRLGAPGRWLPFTATERFTTGRPRFEWHARIRLAPLVSIDVCDAYLMGAASTRATLFGYPLVDQRACRELNEGALQRYLAEAVWFPTTLMSGPALTWDVIDPQNAVASIQDRKTSASVLFRFNDDGEVSDILSPARYRATKNGFELTPWAVRCRDYFDAGGFRIPRHCEVEWLLPEGPLMYWRGEVTDARYQLQSTGGARMLPWPEESEAPAATRDRRCADRSLMHA